jgi:hypothetical protein
VHDEDARYPHPLSIQHSIFSSLKDKVLRSPIEIAALTSPSTRPEYRLLLMPATGITSQLLPYTKYQ